VSEKIKLIKFEHFRGLPNNEFKLQGKSLVLLGANGKGKSSIVDGIEFLCSGKVKRFVGAGTGNIDHDDAVRHIHKLGDTKVTAALYPSNGRIARDLDGEDVILTDEPGTQEYFEQHKGVDAFILRRAKILSFVCDQDADRYQKFIKLLGISHIDQLQRGFVDAEKEMDNSAKRARSDTQSKLATFSDPSDDFKPYSLDQILERIHEKLQTFGVEPLENWSEATERLASLKAMRPEVNKEKVDALTKALVRMESPLPHSVSEDIESANTLRVTLKALEAASTDAPRWNVISEGIQYLTKHDSEVSCPLCEDAFKQPLPEVLDRLKQRSDALEELKSTTDQRRALIGRIQGAIIQVVAQLNKDLEHAATIGEETTKTLQDALDASVSWQGSIKSVEAKQLDEDLNQPTALKALVEVRNNCAKSLKDQKTALTTEDSSKLENAIALLERSVASHQEIADAEEALAKAHVLAARAKTARQAFSDARESAIQTVFDQIAATVLNYYQRLHNFEGDDEQSECTTLNLTSTNRSAAGGLRLAIEFLGAANSRDPRGYLSEGHLDSLGLCLFLASVRIFNQPGSLLVLDDVLTSIDKEHRRRVGELLLQEFSDFQIIITTHDEHWHDLLKSSVNARGQNKEWSFRKLQGWTIHTGPKELEIHGPWEFIEANLTEKNYRELGGSFRLILEDFLKRTAAKIEVKIRYRFDGDYTSGDFFIAGIHNKIRNKLIEFEPDEESVICSEISKVFGQGNFINFLSHDNPGRLEVTYDQARDFVQGIKELTQRCKEHKLIRGQ
tara:strand:+ start:889 stop:3252 length:2364 start_codon:yes stop_codon:yes gene_type:complete